MRKTRKKLSTAEIEALKNAELYPARVLQDAFGYVSTQPIHKAYDAGILTPEDCVQLYHSANVGKKGGKRGLLIRGREIKRICLRDGFRRKGWVS